MATNLKKLLHNTSQIQQNFNEFELFSTVLTNLIVIVEKVAAQTVYYKDDLCRFACRKTVNHLEQNLQKLIAKITTNTLTSRTQQDIVSFDVIDNIQIEHLTKHVHYILHQYIESQNQKLKEEQIAVFNQTNNYYRLQRVFSDASQRFCDEMDKLDLITTQNSADQQTASGFSEVHELIVEQLKAIVDTMLVIPPILVQLEQVFIFYDSELTKYTDSFKQKFGSVSFSDHIVPVLEMRETIQEQIQTSTKFSYIRNEQLLIEAHGIFEDLASQLFKYQQLYELQDADQPMLDMIEKIETFCYRKINAFYNKYFQMIHQSPNIKKHLHSLMHFVNYFYDVSVSKDKTKEDKIKFYLQIHNIMLGKSKNLKNLIDQFENCCYDVEKPKPETVPSNSTIYITPVSATDIMFVDQF